MDDWMRGRRESWDDWSLDAERRRQKVGNGRWHRGQVERNERWMNKWRLEVEVEV